MFQAEKRSADPGSLKSLVVIYVTQGNEQSDDVLACNWHRKAFEEYLCAATLGRPS